MAETFRRLLSFIEPGNRAVWIGLALLAVVVTGLEVAAALLIFVVAELLAGGSIPVDLPVVGDPRQRFGDFSDHQVLLVAMAGIAVFFAIRAGVVLLQSYVRARVAERTGVRLSSRLLRGYLAMPYPFHLQRNSAELIRNVNEAVKEVVDFTLVPALRIASEVLVIVGLFVALVVTAPLAAGLAVVSFVPLMLLLLRIVQPRTQALGETSHEMGKSAIAMLQQSLHGFRDIAILGRRAYFEDRYRRIREEVGRARYLQQFFGDVPRVALETGLVLFVTVYVVLATAFGGTTEQSLAVLGMFAYTALRILPSLSRVVLQMNDLRYGAAAAATVHRDLVMVESAASGAPVTDPEGDPAHDLTPRQAIRLEHVIYRYPGAESDALTDVTLEIRPGASIGIVGPTGGGKSTLVDVILGLLPPTAGRVLADDVDISLDVGSWQAHLGVVPQTVYLLDTTLRRNIALGFDDAAIDDGLVEEAVRVAQLDGVVASLPNGLDTEVGERGIRFSGGQRQRVAIARALYRRPAVLVLDEGTSALDAVTEAALLKALAAADRHRSLIIVAHRLTSIQHCDEVLFVEGGQVVDIGPYAALVDRNPAFRRMAQATLTSQASVHARDG